MSSTSIILNNVNTIKNDRFFKRLVNKIKNIFSTKEKTLQEIIDIADGKVSNLTLDDLTIDERIKLLNHKELSSEIIQNYIKIFLSDLKIEKKGGILSHRGDKYNTHIPNNFYTDMEIFEENDTDKENNTDNSNVFEAINRCDTAYGKYVLTEVLKNPTNDKNVLLHRQENIKKICNLKNVEYHTENNDKIEKYTENKDNKEQNNLTVLQKLYLEMTELSGNIEKDILWFWNNNDISTKALFELVYFNNFLKILNKNETFLYFSNMYNIFISPITSALTPLMSIIIPYILLKVFNVPIGVSDFKSVIGDFIGTQKDNYKSIFSMLLWGFFYLHNIYNIYKSSLGSYRIINIIHKKINNLAFFLNKSINLFKIVKKYDININLNDNSINVINETFNNINDENKSNDDEFHIDKSIEIFDNLINKHDLFHKEPYLLSNKGKILATFTKFNQNKRHMINIFNFVAKLDFYLGLTKLYDHTPSTLLENYSSSSNNENTYTYKMPQYLSNEVVIKDKENNIKKKIRKKPKLIFEGIWHPCLKNHNPVPNNIIINNKIKSKNKTNDDDKTQKNNKTKNMLITGPNASGKSTYIKTVSVAILLSQTIGLCPVSSNSKVHVITPFKVLNSYLKNIDIKGVRSGFEAEMYKCKEHINLIKKLKSNEYSYVAMDEILVTTNYKEGVAGAYAICNELSRYSNSISLITTHYTNLSTFNDNQFTYYKFDVNRDNDVKNNDDIKSNIENNKIKHNILYTYQLKKGISNNYIALEILKNNGFEKRIIDDAIEIAEYIKIPKIEKKKNIKNIENK